MNNLSFEQQRIINMYINQYNMTTVQIERLTEMLEEIKTNINNVIRPSITPINNRTESIYEYVDRISNASSRSQNTARLLNNPSYYSNSTFRTNSINANTNANTNNRRTNELSAFSDILINYLNTNVPVRPTQTQIELSTRLVSYATITNPMTDTCPISLERFQPNEIVRQIRSCGHIFCQQPFQQWFSNNVRCPVCRYDIRTYTETTNSNASNSTNSTTTNATTTNATTDNVNTNAPMNNSIRIVEDTDTDTEEEKEEEEEKEDNVSSVFSNFLINRNPTTNQIDDVTFDVTDERLSNNIVRNLSQRILETMFLPQTNGNNNPDIFRIDPSNNILMYETIIRAPNRHSS